MAIRAQPSVIGQGSAQVIPGSTIFDSTTTDHLKRTPSTAGNQRTWTLSFWIKRTAADDGTHQAFFSAGDDPWVTLMFNNTGYTNPGTIQVNYQAGQGSGPYSAAARRDHSGFYNIVVAFDTTQPTAANRIKCWVNGVEDVLGTNSFPNQNTEWGFNSTNEHRIADRKGGGGEPCKGKYSNFYIIDGQALDATDFGYTDRITNTWRPRKVNSVPTQINDSTTWSSTVTSSTGSYYTGNTADKLFDGSLATAVDADTSSGYIEWTPSSVISFASNLQVYHNSSSVDFLITHGDDSTTTYSVSSGNLQWHTLITGSSTIKKIRCTPTNNDYVNWRAIKLDGIIMVDGSNVNATTEWYGTNGSYLPLDGTGYSAFQTIGNMVQDQSGNQNNWTSSGSPKFTTDSPSGVSGQVNLSGITTTGYPTNYAGISPLFRNSAQGGTNESICVVRKGGTNAWYNSSAGENRFKCNSIDVVLDYTQGGKYYWEMSSAGGDYCQMGLCREERLVDINRSNWGISGPGTGYGCQSDGSWGNNRTTINSAGTASWTTYGDIVGMVIDMDEYKIMTWVNGTKNSYEVDFSGKIDFRYRHWWPMIALGYNGSDMNAAEDCNIWTGQEPFNYLPDIDNLKPLCAANLSKGTLIRPDTYFKPVMYTGEDASNTSGTGNTWGIPVDVGFDPDLVICKSKTQTYGWFWFDSVRRGNDSQGDPVPGAALECYNYLNSATTGPQGNGNGDGLGLRRNGFNVDVAGQSIGEAGQGANNMIAYCWKAGGYSNTFNKDGVGYASASDAGLDAGSISPTGSSVNTKQGFSIIKYQGNNNNVTISHGLNEAPTLLIQKFVSGGGNWNIWMSALSSTERLTFTSDANSTGYWNSTLPTDTVFSIGSGINDDGVDMIAYLWHDIPGVQKFGRYYGNNQGADGPYIQLGFKPAVVIVKGHDFASNWNILDGTRDTHNLTSQVLRFNSTAAQASTTSGTYAICGDITSNGFKIRAGSATNDINDAGQEFIYLAWAESPFGNFNGAQSNAR